jgi:hypothetical protein
MKARLVVTLFLHSCCGGQAPTGLPARSCVFDEGKRDLGLTSVRGALIKALRDGDGALIRRLTASNAQCGFGGGVVGPDCVFEFVRDPANRIDLIKVLDLGGGYDPHGLFWSPFAAAVSPPDQGVAGSVVGLYHPIRVRAYADTKAPTIGLLPLCKAVLSDDASAGYPRWLFVRLDRNRAGYVDRSSVIPLAGLRVGFQRTESGWLIRYLLSGD